MIWLRRNLFATQASACVTLVLMIGVIAAAFPLMDWAIVSADWLGETRADCAGEGACWVFIKARFGQFMYGFYPEAERWRIAVAALMVLVVAGLFLFSKLPARGLAGVCLLVIALLTGFVLLRGGLAGLPSVEPRQWGGLTLSLVITIAGLAIAIPLGVLLALGRRSNLPVIRIFCVAFIELWRAVPLITVLFMASVMLPLFLPEGLTIEKLLRALIGVGLFAGAYMAEVVRGGLQAIPRGQYEAAAALGLGYWRTMGFVILPQALRHVIPGLINTVIALFKDTTLVLIIGMFDFLGIIQAALTDPDWLGFALEGYVFAALVYWVICFSLSRLSLAVERRAPGYRAPIAGAMT
ncbi:MAG: amino acid ABC transporter permease [Rhodospirillaceae bacterium]|jgi:general L-amino acid transport system permease protein|nr:amino acid ABC transporter permease [Rhodospirillaceae bacterium]MBT5458311.1 amino acid ABC transporter permease [Rhodospirillaceae bacterium]